MGGWVYLVHSHIVAGGVGGIHHTEQRGRSVVRAGGEKAGWEWVGGWVGGWVGEKTVV